LDTGTTNIDFKPVILVGDLQLQDS